MASVNEYERARNERILANESKLKSLRIKEVAAALKPNADVPVVPQPIRKRKVQHKVQLVKASRKSARNQGKVAPIYVSVPEPRERHAKAARTFRNAGKGAIRHNVDPDKFPYATREAIQEAQDAAETLADELNEKAGHIVAVAKVMQVSHVSGGFWLQNPQAVTDCFGPSTTSHKIELECSEPCPHKERYQHLVEGSHNRWAVQYLPRPGGRSSGMSGGWIYFATDHALTPNDTVVMEVVSGKGPKYVRVFIFRAKLQKEA